jgi:hypothetical protein
MSNPIKALADVRRRLAKRTAYVPGPPAEAVAAALRAALAEIAIVHAGRACLVPVEPVPETPAMMLVHRQLDEINRRFAAEETAAKAERRRLKLERRRIRREQAVREAATAAKPVTHGLPQETVSAVPPVAVESPKPAEPVDMASLRF